MRILLKYALCMVVSCVCALTDKIAVVVNDNVITELELEAATDNFAILSGNTEHRNDSNFKQYVSSLVVTNKLVQDFAEHNKIGLTPDEEAAAIKFVMDAQGLDLGDFDQSARDAGIDPEWMKAFILANALQQKVGMYVVAPSVSVEDDMVEYAKQQYLNEHTEYKIKSWTVGHDEAAANVQSIKVIKQVWAESGKDPVEGEVQDLGWKKRGELPKIFLDALKGVSPGNLVGPIQSGYGYHLVWFEGENLPDLPDDESIRQSLFQEKYMEAFNAWLGSLHQYNVVIYK